MYKIITTELAQKDLEDILSYLTDTLANPTAVTNLLDTIEKCYQELQTTPMIYGKCHDPQLKKAGYRRAVIKNYIMIYRVDSSQQSVYILRFFYGPRDYEKLI